MLPEENRFHEIAARLRSVIAPEIPATDIVAACHVSTELSMTDEIRSVEQSLKKMKITASIAKKVNGKTAEIEMGGQSCKHSICIRIF
jgi:hypothetical protein